MSAAVNEAVLADFHGRFRRLGAHPDKAVIDDCVRFAKANADQGYHIAKAMVSRYMDRNKDIRCLLAILYCMDAIMVYAEGEYPAHFSRYMVDVCLRGFDCMDEHGRTKLGILIQIWDERSILSSELVGQLIRMKTDKLAQPASTPSFQAPRVPPPQQSMALGYPHNLPHNNQQQQVLPQAPQLHIPGTAPGLSSHSSYESLLSVEKESLLNELLQSLGESTGSMTLEQLAQSNMELYNNICVSAEANASAKYGGGGAMPMPQMMPPAQPQPQPQAQPSSVTAPQIPTQAMMVVDESNDKGDVGRSADTFLSKWSELDHHASATDGDGYVRGYIATRPVLISVEGVEILQKRLGSCEESLQKVQETGGIKQEEDEDYDGDDSSGANGNGNATIPLSDAILSTQDSRASVATALARVKRKLSAILADATQSSLSSSSSSKGALPSLVTGPLPLLPSSYYSRSLQEYLSAETNTGTGAGIGTGASAPGRSGGRSGGSRFSARKQVVPAFLMDQLNMPAAYALQALYVHRKYQFQEDGVRFLSQATLDAYVDKYAGRQLIRKLTANIIKRRPWFCSEEQWNNDFGEASSVAREQTLVEAAGREDDGGGAIKIASVTGSSGGPTAAGTDTGMGVGAVGGQEDVREYSVLADELFTRCPISRERFVSTFDGESGEMWYKNAAKVLVTSMGDVQVYNLAKDTEHPQVRYVIVNKPLVLDSWIESGKAASFTDTLQRYKAMGAEHSEKITDLQMAVQGEGEDEETYFVMLELSA